VVLTQMSTCGTDQDDQLEDLSTLVSSTKHISLAIGEEVGLQNRLLVRTARFTSSPPTLRDDGSMVHRAPRPFIMLGGEGLRLTAACMGWGVAWQEDLEHDMETSQWRIKTATKRALDLFKKSNNFTFMVRCPSKMLGTVADGVTYKTNAEYLSLRSLPHSATGDHLHPLRHPHAAARGHT
jgi:hypothetical protein